MGALCPCCCEDQGWGRPTEHPATAWRLTQPLSLSTLGLRDKGRGASALLFAYRQVRSGARAAAAGAEWSRRRPRHPSLRAV